MIVTLPFPPSDFSGHNNGQWYNKSRLIATYRAEAFHETRNAMRRSGFEAPEEGDICLTVTFFPANNLGDRVNFANRMKPQIDGIAEALGVNDKRFLPAYFYPGPSKPGRVEIEIYPLSTGAQGFTESPDSAIGKGMAERCDNTPGHDPISEMERTNAA